VRQVDSVGAVLCCWLHMARWAVILFAKSSPVLQVRPCCVEDCTGRSTVLPLLVSAANLDSACRLWQGMRKADEQTEQANALMPPSLPSFALRGDLAERMQSMPSFSARNRSVSLGATDTPSSRSAEGRAAEGGGSDGSGSGGGVERQNSGVSPTLNSYTGTPMSPTTMSRIRNWQAAVGRAADVPPLVRSDSNNSLVSEASVGNKDWAWLGSFASDEDSGAVSVFAQRRHRCLFSSFLITPHAGLGFRV
jgi:hypothetical protein